MCPGGPWRPTFALGWLQNHSFCREIIRWAPWISQHQGAQPRPYSCNLPFQQQAYFLVGHMNIHLLKGLLELRSIHTSWKDNQGQTVRFSLHLISIWRKYKDHRDRENGEECNSVCHTTAILIDGFEHNPQLFLVICHILDKLFKWHVSIKVLITKCHNLLQGWSTSQKLL